MNLPFNLRSIILAILVLFFCPFPMLSSKGNCCLKFFFLCFSYYCKDTVYHIYVYLLRVVAYTYSLFMFRDVKTLMYDYATAHLAVQLSVDI